MLKKILLLVAVIVGITFTATAQEFSFKKNDIIVEGGFIYSVKDNKDNVAKDYFVSFIPVIGYFVSDKIVVGLSGGITNSKLTLTVGPDNNLKELVSSNKQFIFSTFGRYYFLELGSRFKTYAGLNLNYFDAKPKSIIDNNVVNIPKIEGYGASTSLGMNYFLTKRFAVNFNLGEIVGFRSVKSGEESASLYQELSSNINVFGNFFEQSTFGLTYKF
ncbi:Outer membrane protein W [Sphingobacterium spiritivorum]|uniref:Outer membrane protein W n=1 Tax=Sphingobacterium spiritivorum TaxID=258 RepID=A0A380CKE5_SPHSI|nr:OmpW family outer membrane protein [Sphingobacterium spiritivorum]SUJ22268.1 Outer membrane protein W [Sphingobacterium spiritivorum]